MEEEQQRKTPNVFASDTELSYTPKKPKKIDDETPVLINAEHADHQHVSLNRKNGNYCSFSTTNKKSPDSSQGNSIGQILDQAGAIATDLDEDEDEQKRKIAAAKKLLFPTALATSFPEVADTLRHERRQEFCPIYNDETSEQIALRQANRKPIGSLLAKRIRWDDLKRKREDNERQYQVPTCYGPYGPIYSNQQPSFPNAYGQHDRNTPNQSQQTFANPYNQYYTAVQTQYAQMTEMTRIQQEYNGFWPGYSSSSSQQNNPQSGQNSVQQQSQPCAYPYLPMYLNNTTSINSSISSPYASTDYNTYFHHLKQPPPPPPTEPYPY